MKTTVKRKIWTYLHTPFRVGGSSLSPMVTEIEPIEEKPIGKGFYAFSFKTPKGTLRIAESRTGSIIASTFKEARNDVRASTRLVIEDQLNKAKKDLESGSALVMTSEEFFEKYSY